MEIHIDKDCSLQDRFQTISSFLQFITKNLNEEETKLIRENLFYEKFLNKQLKAKKQLQHNYMKTNQERKMANSQQSQLSQPKLNELTQEVFENQIEENILNVIQKAESALQEINDDPKPKFQKPEISPYAQNQLKPPMKKPPTSGVQVQKNSVSEKQQTKKPLGRYILHKQPSMQSTYNSAYSQKNSSQGSQRSSSNHRSDPTAQTQSSTARKNSLNSRNSQQNSVQSQQNSKLMQVPQSSQGNINQKSTTQSQSKQQQNDVSLPQINPTSKQQQSQVKGNNTLKQINDVSQSTQASQNQNISKQSTIDSNQQIQNQNTIEKQIQIFEVFQDKSDLFENMDKNELQIYYGQKKKLKKCQKEYQQQQKYYKEKETKARNKFLNKLTSHIQERHLVTQGKLIQYEQSKNQQVQQKQNKKVQQKKQHDKYAEDQEESETKQFDPLYEYTFIDLNNSACQLANNYEQIGELTIKMTGLKEYGFILLDNIHLESNSEEIQFLKSIKQNQDILNEDNNLILLFKVWSFIKKFEQNYNDFKKMSQETNAQLQQVSKKSKESYFPEFLTFQKYQDNSIKKGEEENIIKLIQFQNQEKNTIRYQEQSLQNQFDHTLIFEINKQSVQLMIYQFIDKYIIQYIQDSLLTNINSPKINLKLLQSQLKFIRAISGIVDYSGKILPSFFLTDSIQNYFENIKE